MRGMSELISAVILVAMVVGIGAIVMRFSTNYVKSSDSSISDAKHVDPFASLDIKSVSSSQIMVENTGQKVLKNFRVYVDEEKSNISSAPSELDISQPASITLSNPIPPGKHTIYVLTDKTRTKGEFEVPSHEIAISDFQHGTGYNVDVSNGLELAQQ